MFNNDLFRRIVMLGLVVHLSFTAVVVTAQEGRVSLAGGAGAGVIVPLNQGYEPLGIQGNLSARYGITQGLAAVVGLSYQRLGIEEKIVLEGISEFQSLQSVYGAIQASGRSSGGLIPYFLGGVGLYRITKDLQVEGPRVTPGGDRVVGVLGGVPITRVGLLAGAGVEKSVYEKAEAGSTFAVSLFGEGTFHLILTTDEPLKLITFSVGIRFSTQ